MLRHLYIKNFILIDELNLDFHSGFSAFIGETGAGKSIFIDALSLLKAERASSSFISKGKDKAIIEGTFDLSRDEHAKEVLLDAGFELNDETIFTRELLASGKSVARIDHRVVTLNLMKDVLRDEIDIHGQRDNAYLLNTSRHISLLDAYLQDDTLLTQVHDSYYVWKNLVDEKNKALNETYNESDLEYFQYEIEEIEDANLSIGEDEILQEKEKEYKAMKSSFDKLNQLISLYDNEVSSSLYELNHLSGTLTDMDSIEKECNIINDSYYAINDAMDQIRHTLDHMNMSEEEINEMQERLFTIQKLKRKYGRTIEDILNRKEEIQKQIDLISHRQKYLDEIDAKIAKAFSIFKKYADELSMIRRKGCKTLDELVAKNLNDLILPNARFVTSINTVSPNQNGIDSVEFMISMNKGEDLKPLSQTASGGELSRLMLGLKEIFSSLQGIQTVIFDEIDTGVSGPVASSIGQKMHQISNDTQVFSVTHLAPVAACADYFYFVSKSEEDGRTHTHVQQLEYESIIKQLALISSGEDTENAKLAAEELYRRSQNH